MTTKKSVQLIIYLIMVTGIVTALISCSKEEKKTTATEKKESTDTSVKTTTSKGAGAAGKEIFYMKSKENNVSCADCHSDGTNSDRPLTKYFSKINGADKRSSTYLGKFKGDDVAKNAGGATVCWESYLRMKSPMTDDQIKALNEFYGSLPPDTVKEFVYETIALPERDKTKLKTHQAAVTSLKGDPIKGEAKFKDACGMCHGENTTVKKVPSVLEEFEGNVKSIVYNVRLGDGAMPFYNMGSLSDQEIADIASYIMKNSGK